MPSPQTQVFSLSLVERGEESDFLQGLSLLANPFSNVIHITLLPPRQIYFGRLSLRALSTSFPALKTIEGLLLFPASLEFIESQIEIPEPSTHLVRLEEVTLYEICKSGNYSAQQLIPALEDASVERAFKSLRSLFPSIALAKHVRYELSRKEGFRGTRRQISIMTMHYLSSSAGNHFETTIERSNGRSMTLTVI
ncbi:hypothetical protein SISSUDRAFT_592122 [Sistotremastrum suecicum HHB10207 ss-3]|uniref:Uncharacterized protein n=1 Tax=Sistotremastrum suecicum HHB10207 ss-3 TaxID=1314776 RepID=A0A165XC98_9AGAM|nr:hypothetical protein SISSUDRAFT_592122 [Sistotremastrum suecicum HHB10207 ss-3]